MKKGTVAEMIKEATRMASAEKRAEIKQAKTKEKVAKPKGKVINVSGKGKVCIPTRPPQQKPRAFYTTAEVQYDTLIKPYLETHESFNVRDVMPLFKFGYHRTYTCLTEMVEAGLIRMAQIGGRNYYYDRDSNPPILKSKRTNSGANSRINANVLNRLSKVEKQQKEIIRLLRKLNNSVEAIRHG
jgi:hypothetical protein